MWREIFKPITKRSTVKPKQTQISFDTQVKTAKRCFKFVFCDYSPTRKPSIKEVPPQDDRDEDLDRMVNDFQQQRAAKALQRQWRGYQGRKKLQTEEHESETQERQNQAASTLQKNWRRHRDRVSGFNKRNSF